jgi:hypothetical protein
LVKQHAQTSLAPVCCCAGKRRLALQQQEQQQHDWEAVLKQTLVNQAITHGIPATLPRSLHPVSRGTCDAARATIRHLSLSRYQQGREAAQRMVREAGEPVTPAMAAAAAPPLPWDLLAATPSLTSLDIHGDQLGELVGGEAATAPAAAEATSSAAAQPSPAAAAAAAAGPSVLSTSLGRLRRLRVEGVQEVSQMAHLGRLLASTTQLTQLVLFGGWRANASGGMLLEGLAAAAAAGPGDTAAASKLPPLHHLEIEGHCEGLLPAWLECPKAAAQLTTLKLTQQGAAVAEELQHLPSCSGLQELVIQSYQLDGTLGLPQDLTRLTALTRLELQMHLKDMPAVVWDLTSLRQLAFKWEGAAIPSDISQLHQLRLLSVDGSYETELLGNLGAWLPHLEELALDHMRASKLPRDLTRLTRLTANYTSIRQVSALTHLVTLKELEIKGCMLFPPLQPLTHLSALETLFLGWEHDTWTSALSCHGRRQRRCACQLCRPCAPSRCQGGHRNGLTSCQRFHSS